MLTTSPAPASRATLNGPPSCQTSSQMVSATSTPCRRTIVNPVPGTKYRFSSNTP